MIYMILLALLIPILKYKNMIEADIDINVFIISLFLIVVSVIPAMNIGTSFLYTYFIIEDLEYKGII